MKYKRTILNIASIVFMIGCFLDIIIEYDTLSAGEGWGVVSMIGLMTVGLLGLLIDLVLQIFIKNKTLLNLLGVIAILILGVLIIKDL
jgi:hypothetical protein